MIEKTVSKNDHKRKFWKKTLIILTLIILTVIMIFVGLIMYSTNLQFEVWDISNIKYESGWLLRPSKFTAEVQVAVGNWGVFSAVLKEACVKIFINDIYAGTVSFDEWEIIPAQAWKTWKATVYVEGEDADVLEQTQTYTVRVILKGTVSCFSYSKLCEIWHERTF